MQPIFTCVHGLFTCSDGLFPEPFAIEMDCDTDGTERVQGLKARRVHGQYLVRGLAAKLNKPVN